MPRKVERHPYSTGQKFAMAGIGATWVATAALGLTARHYDSAAKKTLHEMDITADTASFQQLDARSTEQIMYEDYTGNAAVFLGVVAAASAAVGINSGVFRRQLLASDNAAQPTALLMEAASFIDIVSPEPVAAIWDSATQRLIDPRYPQE